MIIICWNSNQSSKIHDHPDNGCLLKVLQGSLTEYNYKFNDNDLQIKNCNKLNVNDIGYQEGSTGLHKICNENNNKVISLHIYSPPNYKCKIY